MPYRGVGPQELSEVRSLNRRFLAHATSRDTPAGLQFQGLLGDELAAWFGEASATQRDRMAAAPYFLFDVCVVAASADRALKPDLFAAAAEGEDELLLLSLGFAWQLARRNRFSVRVVTGADTAWAEWLASVPYSSLATQVRYRNAGLPPILLDNARFWRRLAGAAKKNHRGQIDAALSAGLQHLLNRRSAPAARLAARHLNMPERQVADTDSPGPTRFTD